jgi:hypothetical protein
VLLVAGERVGFDPAFLFQVAVLKYGKPCGADAHAGMVGGFKICAGDSHGL